MAINIPPPHPHMAATGAAHTDGIVSAGADHPDRATRDIHGQHGPRQSSGASGPAEPAATTATQRTSRRGSKNHGGGFAALLPAASARAGTLSAHVAHAAGSPSGSPQGAAAPTGAAPATEEAPPARGLGPARFATELGRGHLGAKTPPAPSGTRSVRHPAGPPESTGPVVQVPEAKGSPVPALSGTTADKDIGPPGRPAHAPTAARGALARSARVRAAAVRADPAAHRTPARVTRTTVPAPEGPRAAVPLRPAAAPPLVGSAADAPPPGTSAASEGPVAPVVVRIVRQVPGSLHPPAWRVVALRLQPPTPGSRLSGVAFRLSPPGTRLADLQVQVVAAGGRGAVILSARSPAWVGLLNAGDKSALARQIEPQLGPTTVLVTSGAGHGVGGFVGSDPGEGPPRSAGGYPAARPAGSGPPPRAAPEGLDLHA
jgi:hypothetical protein